MDDKTFKDALRQWVAGVTVVTTLHEGKPYGMTASSFTSVSINPHLILIAVDHKTFSYHLIKENGFFAANILNIHQVEWAKRFAGMNPEIEDRFFDIESTTATTGAPILPDVIAWVDCKVYSAHEAGDHTIYLGQVVDAQGQGGAEALLYYNRGWGKFTNLPEEN